jgi:hypothetical protein
MPLKNKGLSLNEMKKTNLSYILLSNREIFLACLTSVSSPASRPSALHPSLWFRFGFLISSRLSSHSLRVADESPATPAERVVQPFFLIAWALSHLHAIGAPMYPLPLSRVITSAKALF